MACLPAPYSNMHFVPISSPFVESLTPNSDRKEALAKATKDLMSLDPDHWRVQSAMQNPPDLLRGLHHHTLQLDFQHHRQQSETVSSNGHVASHRNTANTSSSSSRQVLHPSPPSSSSTASSSSSHSVPKHTSSSKRNRASSSTSPTSSETPVTSSTQKQPLLSPSQKKANHIQSEQKRRANIRRGYEALCETVPSLREAIKQEEEEAALVAEKLDGAPGRRRRKKGQGKDGSNGEKDKVDGRAGPRSENVVLTKTIEHIQDLLSDRSALLARLHHARSTLPTGHPALAPVQIDPPWEREWNGGEGKVIADGEEEGASSEGDVDE